MKFKLTSRPKDPRVYMLVFSTDDDVLPLIREFALAESLRSAYFTGIGALRKATVAFFELGNKHYYSTQVGEQVEVLGFTGNLTRMDGDPKLHAHVVLSRRDGSVVGGHLREAIVRPTLELVVTELEADIERQVDEEAGLPFIALSEESSTR